MICVLDLLCCVGKRSTCWICYAVLEKKMANVVVGFGDAAYRISQKGIVQTL